MKRLDYLSWYEYFMAQAILASARSKDPATQVGCCIVDQENKIISVGYNGFPIGCSDDELPWDKNGEWINSKYAYVCHAEVNGIANNYDRLRLKGATIYVSLFPCNECAKIIIQAGIKKVVYHSDKDHNKDFCKAARRLFDMAGIEYVNFNMGKYKKVLINLEEGKANINE